MSEETSKHVLLGMPGYGQMTAGASRGLWRASNNRHYVAVKYNEASLLARNFNDLWCCALNRVHKGGPVDYFAMLHADVEPEDYWLDSLIDELEANNLDVLGAVVPIKHPKGITSLALERPDKDSWRPMCRLTMDEIYNRLPETFTSEDCGAPLLLNTGCWVCKFDIEWAKRVFFTINDRISYSTVHGEYVPEVEPEDWHMSRQFHRLGLRVGATRKVKLTHAGSARFTNAQAWGEDKFDTAYVSQSVIPCREAETNEPAGEPQAKQLLEV